jgi:SpoVK/Ycf46/Vps4 family AAA+-type ATPase
MMKLTGLPSVKRKFINIFNQVQLQKEQGGGSHQSNFNVRFEGNPGTGKTTVAKLYAQFLTEIEILPKNSIVKQVTGSSLTSGGIPELKGILSEAKKAGGGAIFVDEAYQLNPKDDQQGRKVLDFLLTYAEQLRCEEYGSIVWIFAGYKSHMEKLFEHNPGLPSRFPETFLFEDYTDTELVEIFYRGLKPSPPPPPPAPAKKKPRISSAQQNSGRSTFYGYGGQSHRAGEEKEDQWGNTWTFDGSKWEDEYGHIPYRYNTIESLGSASNRVMHEGTGETWEFTKVQAGNGSSAGMWRSSKGTESDRYPGTPAPPPRVTTKPFRVADDRHALIAMQRLGRQRGREGFGNARAVRNVIDRSKERQSDRIQQERASGMFGQDVMELTRDDLLGPKATRTALESSEAMKALMALEGLESVKESVNDLLELVMQNADREERNEKMLEVVLNRVFLGNPGTGKTTVAMLYARILADMGMLSKGEVIMKSPSDFVGDVLGSSEKTTRTILDSAQGNVLVIDEAYGLAPAAGSGSPAGSGSSDPYKAAVVDTIVEQIQARPGDDRVVILVGYRQQMEDMLKSANPGLARRFQIENAFTFDDYSDDSLMRILRAAVTKDGLAIPSEVAMHAISRLAKARAQANFGNAGACMTLLSEAKLRMQKRVAKLSSHERNVLVKQDFDALDDADTFGTEGDLFADLVGMDELKDRLYEMQSTVEMALERNTDLADICPFNWLFVGNPGTGKTTVARRMGQMFKSLGVLPYSDVVECSASEFTTGYVGQADKATLAKLRGAKGKVLFVDEAYRLNPKRGGQFMSEVLDELCNALTSEEFAGKMVVILAGYEDDIDDMLDSNSGLRSRFSAKLLFKDLSSGSIAEMLQSKLGSLKFGGLVLSEAAKSALPTMADQLRNASSFSNGRDVETWAKNTFTQVAIANKHAASGRGEVSEGALAKALAKLMETKQHAAPRPGAHAPKLTTPAGMRTMTASDHAPPPPIPTVSIKTNCATAEKEEVEEEPANEPGAMNLFSEIDAPSLRTLQDFLDDNNMNSGEGVREALAPGNRQKLVNALMSTLHVSREEASSTVGAWEQAQDSLLEQSSAAELKAKTTGMVPIWRCGVCGRSDQTYITCTVAPFIVRYERRGVD